LGKVNKAGPCLRVCLAYLTYRREAPKHPAGVAALREGT
jgi:hypothetical protein